MNNIVFMVNLPEQRKPNRNDSYTFSIKSWKDYCKRHDLELFILSGRIYGESEMNANWHKVYVFELLKANDIQYDKVLIVDSDTIVHPNAPNIFDVSDDNFCAVHNGGNYDWVLRSIEVYSKLVFGEYSFHFTKYFNSGVIVVNEKHEKLFSEVANFYHINRNALQQIQDSFHLGTDQPILNFMVDMKDVELTLLPYEWNMQDMHRSEILNTDMLFTKYGWVYHFNAIPSNFVINPRRKQSPVYQWMEFTYNKLYG